MPGVTVPAIFEAATVIIGRAMIEVPPAMRARIREAVTIGVEEEIDATQKLTAFNRRMRCTIDHDHLTVAWR